MEPYLLKNTDKLIRDLDSIDIDKDENKYLTLIFNLENLSKKLDCKKVMNIIDKYKPQNIIIKNSRVDNPSNMYKDEDLNLNELFISDELYSMSGKLDILFPRFKAKKLTLKKFKISSKFQLNKFLEFIEKVGCEELILEDIFIELLVKENKKDEIFDQIESFISFENGNILFFKNDQKIETKIKKLKMIDCPLFAITEEIKTFKDILIDIDENSLLNPSIITQFKIEEGYSYMYYDLDSFKYNENDENDYLDNLNYIFNYIINEYNNYKKISFKNFDITKCEYITGDNLTFIDEKNWVLNEQEKKRKKKFEEFDKTINELINKNINKLSNVKELVFDNCTNHFIELILKFINSSKNDLDILKIKKCGKEYFDLKNILSLNIKNLILFDTPLIIDYSNKEKTSTNLERFKGDLGKIENLTIKTCSLEHYCLDNNLDYYNTIEIIIELINNKNIGQNLCFEMNTLPIIMTYLIAKDYHKKYHKQEEFKIPQYFEFSEPFDIDNKDVTHNEKSEKIKNGRELRNNLIENNCKLENLKDKSIILKKNNIKNKLENYEELMYLYLKLKIELIKNKDEKTDFGNDVFNLDIDYKNFFKINDINIVILKNCLFSSYSNQRIHENEIEETFINFVKDDKRCYKLDIKTLNEIIYKNKSFDGISSLFKFFSLENKQTITSDTYEYLKLLNVFFINLRNIFYYLRKYIKETTLIFNNIKEIKEFYCLMCIVRVIQDKNNYDNLEFSYHDRPINFMFPKKNLIMEKIGPYYLETKNENDKNVFSVFNYYYRSDEEKEIFGDYKKKKIIIDNYIFGTEYEFN